MIRIAMLLLLYGPLSAQTSSNSDSSQRIQFKYNLNWEQVKQTAKSEGKFIFVDCFATWCAPCKKMDAEVYSNSEVGNLVNGKFVSVKIQMDTGRNDNNEIKSWYATASNFSKNYKVSAYPTFLFFSSDGNLVHRGLGFKTIDDFKELVSDAIRPEKQYYTLLQKYNSGQRNMVEMFFLMNYARSLNDDSTLKKIGADYTNNYVSRLNENELLTKENIELLWQFTGSSHERGFKIFYTKGATIDSVMKNDGYSARFIDKIIFKEEVYPRLQSAKENNKRPDWKSMHDRIRKGYTEQYAQRNISRGKVTWYKWTKEWPNYTSSIVSFVEKYSTEKDRDNWFFINGQAWEIFLYSTNKKELNTAIRWLEKFVHKAEDSNGYNSAVLDTYANLLYKSGDVANAIKWEKEALKLSPTDQETKNGLKKMESGIPTWQKNSQ